MTPIQRLESALDEAEQAIRDMPAHIAELTARRTPMSVTLLRERLARSHKAIAAFADIVAKARAELEKDGPAPLD